MIATLEMWQILNVINLPYKKTIQKLNKKTATINNVNNKLIRIVCEEVIKEIKDNDSVIL